jgi:hypothetical protein
MTICKSSGSLSTNGSVSPDAGALCSAQAIGGTVSLYNGSTSGALLATVTSSGFHNYSNPVTYGSSGLYITLSAGTGVVTYV